MCQNSEPNANASVFWPEVRTLILTDGNVNNYRPTCAICTSTIALNATLKDQNSDECLGMGITPCGHVLGLECLRKWYNADPTGHHRCPICRQNMRHQGCGHNAEVFAFSELRDAYELPLTVPEGGLFPMKCGICRLNDFMVESIATIHPPPSGPNKTTRIVGVIYELSWLKFVSFSNQLSRSIFKWHALLRDGTNLDLDPDHEGIRVHSNEEMKLCIQKCIKDFLKDNHEHYWEPTWAGLEVTSCNLASRIEDLI